MSLSHPRGPVDGSARPRLGVPRLLSSAGPSATSLLRARPRQEAGMRSWVTCSGHAVSGGPASSYAAEGHSDGCHCWVGVDGSMEQVDPCQTGRERLTQRPDRRGQVCVMPKIWLGTERRGSSLLTPSSRSGSNGERPPSSL